MNPIAAFLRSFARTESSGSRNLWLMRLFYLTYIGGSAFITPFFTLFYQRQGLSGAEIGTLSTLGSLCTMLSAPIWARLASSVIKTKHAIQIGAVFSGISLLLLSQQEQFGGMAAVVVARMLLIGGVSPLTVALVLKVIARRPEVGFGSVRVWASIGWAITSLIAGYVIEKNSFEAGFMIAAVIIFASALMLIPVTEESPHAPETIEPRSRSPLRVVNFVTADFILLKNKALLLLAVALVITWISRTGAMSFQAIYMADLGAGESLIGVMNMMGALIEMPGMIWADRLLRKHGPARLLVSAFALQGLGFLGVVLFRSIPAILVGQALSGMVLSLTSVSEMRYIQQHSPAEKTGSAVALITVTLNAMVTITISPIAGFLFDSSGAHVLFVIGVVGQILAAGVMGLALRAKRLPQ